jgi:O-antigen biosynthesis protein WbqP
MYRRFLKRPFDIIVSLIALILLSPFLLLVALAIYLEDKGPVLFKQIRVGRGGREFEFLKFRSMPVTSIDMPKTEAQNLEITRVGRFIRRTNIDELPQLINILRGEMSIVGPRPAIRVQDELCKMRAESGALECLPGLTGLAQVNAYDGMPESEKARWDSEYAVKISFATDSKIILRTFSYLTRRPPVY